VSPQRPHIPDNIRQQVEKEARYRCGYCLTEQRFTAKKLHVEHIIPIAAGGGSEPDNLWLACDLCNSYKGFRTHALDPVTDQTVPLFNPRQQGWYEHFTWSTEGTHVLGLTPIGRATVIALRLNHPFLVEARRWWVEAGWHPPAED
jgi:hypothetical protein